MYKNKILYKIYFYNLSLVPLYITFIIQEIKFDSLFPPSIEHYKTLFSQNIVSIVLMALVLLSFITIWYIKREIRYGLKNPEVYTNIKPADFEHLAFISTYIIPLVAFKFDTPRDILVLCFVIFFMGLIYIRAGLYYLNPILLLFGYKIFKGSKGSGKEYILLTREETLSSKQSLQHIDLGGNIHYVKKP
ncbi:anti-phage protein KwaA [Hydrogenimonas sp.]